MLEQEKKYINQAQKGNKEAFSFLYNHYLPGIYRYIFFKVSKQEEAEDITHEVFLSAWQNVKGYKYKGLPFSSWLYQIARNAVIDFYRTSKKTVQIEMVNEEFIKIQSRDPEILNAEMELEKIKKTIALLKPEYQNVLIMRFIEELPHNEVATALGKSEGAVRLIQHRALKELKSLYNETTNGKDIKEI